jgi:hypothetical protein
MLPHLCRFCTENSGANQCLANQFPWQVKREFFVPKRELNPPNRELRELATMLRRITAEDHKRTANKRICKIQ